jgi:hypothetical protein
MKVCALILERKVGDGCVMTHMLGRHSGVFIVLCTTDVVIRDKYLGRKKYGLCQLKTLI